MKKYIVFAYFIALVLFSGCIQSTEEATLAANPCDNKECNDNDPCTVDSCNPITGECEQMAIEDGACKEEVSKQTIFTTQEMEEYEKAGRHISKHISYTLPEIISDRAKVGEKLLLEGNMQASIWEEGCGASTPQHGFVEGETVNIQIYKNDSEVYSDTVMTDGHGQFQSETYVPEEPGNYKAVFRYAAGNCDEPLAKEGLLIPVETSFHVSSSLAEGGNEEDDTGLMVSEVIDGDTVVLNTGEEVRLIGINAPESEQQCNNEAKDKLIELVLGKEVILEKDVSDVDQYGRHLRYLFVDDLFVNKELVRLGLATVYEYPPDTKYASEILAAEEEAKQKERCLWQEAETNYIKDECIQITNFHFNASGNDNYNLNDEYVSFKNTCSYSIDMAGWTIKDEANNMYNFPSFTLEQNSTFTLYSGVGTNTNTKLYWARSGYAVWNNTGDTLYMRNSNGDLVLNYRYAGYD